MARKPRKKPSSLPTEASSQPRPTNTAVASIPTSQPIFGEPAPSPDPKTFFVKHLSDNPLYNALNKKLLQAIPPPPREGASLVLKLAEVLGEKPIQKIQAAGRIVLHSVGDTGPIAGPENQSLVADKMVNDFKEVTNGRLERSSSSHRSKPLGNISTNIRPFRSPPVLPGFPDQPQLSSVRPKGMIAR